MAKFGRILKKSVGVVATALVCAVSAGFFATVAIADEVLGASVPIGVRVFAIFVTAASIVAGVHNFSRAARA